MANRLADATSPYLLQHAHNPVDWYEWGEDALRRAEREDRPIFLSIGYAACHWCHVMERESFEDEATAGLMNERFVCIKVDREERPDLDNIYMNAVQVMTGRGGWPMSVFLTPEGVPFYAGTYFPPDRRHGLPSFREVLTAVADAWANRRDEVRQKSGQILPHLVHQVREPGDQQLDQRVLEQAALSLGRLFDRVNGGWGDAPKFPQPATIEFLLRLGAYGEAAALEMAELSLQKMARGGIYDHLGGGFHRYAVESIWLVPHFEKMLYDNSQLASVYLHANRLTGKEEYGRVARETLDYVAREMQHAEGGFYSTQDADSEGEEGKFYVWTPAEIKAVAGDDTDLFLAAYGVTGEGNFEGKNVLERVAPDEALAARFGLSVEEVPQRLERARHLLLAERSKRVWPGLDDKVLTAWNGLMLAAFAEGAWTLEAPAYLDVARRNAEFLLREMRDREGRLLRSWRRGRAQLNGYLEDYTHLAHGLLVLYEATFEERWFVEARALMDYVAENFRDPAGGFFDTSDDHEQLIVRPKDLQDNAVPCGNSMAADVFARLWALTGDERYYELALSAIGQVQALLGQAPLGFGRWLCAFEWLGADPVEVAVVGNAGDEATEALIATARRAERPRVVAASFGGATQVPLLDGRTLVEGRPAAYVCRNMTCDLPATDPARLEAQLAP
jgi:uncharacterized protein YyaL (SSP411 family)